MDYTLILNEINNNQVQILNYIKDIEEGVFCLVLVSSIIFFYIFLRNMTK